MNDTTNILVVDDDKNTRVVLTALLEEQGYLVKACETREEALNHIMAEEPLEVVISDLKLPDGNGLQILWPLKKINPDAAFILITGYVSLETAIQAVNEGAFAYQVKPLDIDALINSTSNALNQRRLAVENRTLLDRVLQFNQELEDKNRELERASLAKTQILWTVSHELKTPLTGIIGYTDRLLLERERVGALNERQERYLETVQQNSQRLKALIEDLLEISRIESGSLELSIAELDVREEIETVV